MKLKELEEKTALTDLSKTVSEVEKINNHIRQYNIESTRISYNEADKLRMGQYDAKFQKMASLYLNMLKKKKNIAERRYIEIEPILQRKREKVIETRKKKRVIEIIKEKKEREYKYEIAREEIKFLDEQFVRNKKAMEV
ncbi:MAG: hypothetical protein OEZ13_02235 [Spirochaetia bacterium]|nr:hypothetical protein [Spirochaetia bacterium]